MNPNHRFIPLTSGCVAPCFLGSGWHTPGKRGPVDVDEHSEANGLAQFMILTCVNMSPQVWPWLMGYHAPALGSLLVDRVCW